MKKLTPLLWAGIIIALVLVVFGGSTAGMWIYAYNGEITHGATATKERANINTTLISRYEKVGAFIDAIQNANATILTYLETIRDARIAFADAINNGALDDAEAETEIIDSTFTNLVAYMEDNPESYNTITLYEGYLGEFSASTNAVVYAIDEFNDAVLEYNTFVQVFPNVLFLKGKVLLATYNYNPDNYNPTLPTFN